MITTYGDLDADGDDLVVLGREWMKRSPFADIGPEPGGDGWVNLVDSQSVTLTGNATLDGLYTRLGIPSDEVKTAFVNSVMRQPDYTLRDGDHVGVFPPVGGG